MKEQLELMFNHLRKNPILEGFGDTKSVLSSFSANVSENDIDVCHAWYDTPPYEGYAIAIFFDKRDNKFYENHGSHCSCHGLEDQWNPEEINFVELYNRIMNVGFLGSSDLKRLWDTGKFSYVKLEE